MHVAILYDGETVTEWQRQALEQIAGEHSFSYLIHEDDGPPSRRQAQHGLYYALNLVTIRNRLTKAVALTPPAQALVKRFTPQRDGMWSVLPPDVLDWLRDNKIDAVLKFGLNLLRIPENASPILSYHHGDPRHFRGRPAGFYEVLQRRPFMGQIVQILSNKLDAGSVLAFTETRVHPHSYRKTLLEAYRASPKLLATALSALATVQTLPIAPTGKNYRLPGNATVARFLGQSGWRFMQRIAYGAFVEKRWNVSTVSLPPETGAGILLQALEQSRKEWATLPVLPGYTFYADGFFLDGSSDILVEAMNATSGKGEIVRIVDGVQQRINVPKAGHISYPQAIEENGIRYVVPEIADWSKPAAFVIEGDSMREIGKLDIDASGILDPTLFHHQGRVYLLGNHVADGTSALHLWSADTLFGRFELHPASPVHTGIRGGRMAGQILRDGERLLRFGQDFGSSYGDGVICFRIDRLDATKYRETAISDLSFGNGVKGPHTVNRHGDAWIFDWYTERKSLLAGVRRLRNRI